MCDDRLLLRLSAFSPLGGSRPLFPRFPFPMGFRICALSGSLPDLTGRSTVHQERSPALMRSPARHFIAPFLHRPLASAESIYIDAGTANQRYRFDLLQRRCRPSPLNAYKCGPCPLSGRWLHLQDLINPALHFPMKVPITNIQKAFFQLTDHLKYNEVVWIGTRASIFLMAVFDVLRGIQEVLLDLRLPHNFPGSRNIVISADLSKTTTSSAFKKYMGKMSFSRLFGYWLRDSSCMVR